MSRRKLNMGRIHPMKPWWKANRRRQLYMMTNRDKFDTPGFFREVTGCRIAVREVTR
jgi:hypothetical protein